MHRVLRAAWLLAEECIAASAQSSAWQRALAIGLTALFTYLGINLSGWATAFGYDIGPLAGWLAAAVCVATVGGFRLAFRVVAIEEQSRHDFFVDSVNMIVSKMPEGCAFQPKIDLKNSSSATMRYRVESCGFWVGSAAIGAIGGPNDVWNDVPRDSTGWFRLPSSALVELQRFEQMLKSGAEGETWFEASYSTDPPTRIHVFRKQWRVNIRKDIHGELHFVQFSTKWQPPEITLADPNAAPPALDQKAGQGADASSPA